MTENQYFVRTGSHEGVGHGLSVAGTERAKRAGWILGSLMPNARGEENVVVMASNAKRTMQTAQAIGDVLGVEVIPSRRLLLAGHQPQAIEDLDLLADTVLAETDHMPLGDRRLVVVTHLPLLAAVRDGNPFGWVAFGETVPYIPGSWDRQLYSPDAAASLEARLAVPPLPPLPPQS